MKLHSLTISVDIDTIAILFSFTSTKSIPIGRIWTTGKNRDTFGQCRNTWGQQPINCLVRWPSIDYSYFRCNVHSNVALTGASSKPYCRMHVCVGGALESYLNKYILSFHWINSNWVSLPEINSYSLIGSSQFFRDRLYLYSIVFLKI